MEQVLLKQVSFRQQSSPLIKRQLLSGCLAILLLVVGSMSGLAAEVQPWQAWADGYVIDQPWDIQSERPTVALALAGGGARALTNIGVILALTEAGVPIDMLVGTSMGALVAILYGSGMHLDQMVELLTEVDVSPLFYLNAPFTKSFMAGDRFNQAVTSVVPVKWLEEFPIRTALVSFDLNHGVRYVQTQGPVLEAVDGPYAVLGAFPGASRHGRFLVDAGTQEATPALAARVLGADIVIATTAFNDLTYTEYDTPLRAWSRMINVIRHNLSYPVAYEYSDVVIAMDVGHYSFTDFQLAERFVEYGYEHTQAQLPSILKLLEEHGVALGVVDRQRDPGVDIVVDHLRRDRLPYSKSVVQPLFSVGPGQGHLQPWFLAQRGIVLQSGIRVEQNLWDATLLLNNIWQGFDISVRRKQLTKQWDGTVAIGASAGQPWLAWGVERRGSLGRVQTGFGWSPDHDWSVFLRGATDQPRLQSEMLLLWSEQQLHGFAGFAANGAVGPWQLQSYAVSSFGHWPYTPKRYRGYLPEESVPWQYGVEVGWEWNTERTEDLLNIAQFDGLDVFAFADGMYAEQLSWTLGLGTRFELNLLGLKPSFFSAWAGYDLQEKRPTVGCTVNLRF